MRGIRKGSWFDKVIESARKSDPEWVAKQEMKAEMRFRKRLKSLYIAQIFVSFCFCLGTSLLVGSPLLASAFWTIVFAYLAFRKHKGTAPFVGALFALVTSFM